MASHVIILSIFFIALYLVIYVQKSLSKDKYNKLIKKNDFKGFLKLTKLYLGEEKHEKALETIDKWLEQNPYHLQGLSTKAFIYYFKGDYKNASMIVNHGLNLDPEYSEFLYLAGELEIENGNKESGKELKEKAYEQNKNLQVLSTWYIGYPHKINRYIELYK